MKRISQVLVPVLFTLGDILCISLGIASLLLTIGYGMAIGIDGGEAYPRFAPFCFAVSVCCVLMLLLLFFVNWLVAEKYAYNLRKWGLQLMVALPISLALTQPWMTFLEFLHRVF